MNPQGFIPPEGLMAVPMFMAPPPHDAFQHPWGAPPPYVPALGPPGVGGYPFPGYPFPGYIPPHHVPWGFNPVPPPVPAAPTAPVAPAAPAAPAAAPRNPAFPPGIHLDGRADGLLPGQNYLFPPKHTTLQVICNGYDPAANPFTEFEFAKFIVPSNITVGDLITQLGSKVGGDDKCGVTELLEVGNGTWVKGVTVFQKDAQKKQTLAQMGWDDTRKERNGTNGEKGPVWLRLLKA